MANYLLIASALRPFDGPVISAPDVYDLMMRHECWEVTKTSPHFRKMKPGDTLVFYLGGSKGGYIAGEAEIASEATAINEKSPVTFNRKQIPYFAWRIPLTSIRRYEQNKVGLDVVERLSFAKDSNVERKYIGLLLRNGCRILTEDDLEVIREALLI